MDSERPFLGRGWSFPPTFSIQGADVEMVSGADDVQESLQILLATTPGQRVMQESFGCDMDRMIFGQVDQAFIDSLAGLVSDSILDYEPRVYLNKVSVDQSDAVEGMLLIRIDYTVRSTNSRFNMVYPFYLKEAATRV